VEEVRRGGGKGRNSWRKGWEIEGKKKKKKIKRIARDEDKILWSST
jgi:hypothetical protein